MGVVVVLCVLATIVSPALAEFVQQAKHVELQTTLGTVRGVEEIDTKTGRRVACFYGIPYAQPPVESLRFRSPIAKKPWTGVLDCTREKINQTCPQFMDTFGHEDCLYLNVYIPIEDGSEFGDKQFPMFFWIYGGGYVFGDDFEFGEYDGKNLATGRQVVVVAPNYRLGAFGFLALEELAEESPVGSTGNMGVQDQQLALRFAHENTNAFSALTGDITIAGESAGAFSVCWHIASEISTRYFRAAVMESGTCSSPIFFIQKERAITFGNEIVAQTKCQRKSSSETLACLRSRDARAFFDQKFAPLPIPGTNHSIRPPLALLMPYGPAIDGTKEGLQARPIKLLGAKPWTHKPLIVGCNKDEGSLFMVAMPEIIGNVTFPLSREGFLMSMLHFYNETTAHEIVDFYRVQHPNITLYDRASLVLRDTFFLCPAQYIAEELTKADVPVWRYFFRPSLPTWVDYDVLGDYHTLELNFVFDVEFPPIAHPWGLKESYIADNMGIYWSNLAYYADANGGAVHKKWPKYTLETRQHLDIQYPIEIGEKLESETCEFWRSRFMKFD
eukprot:m.8434 g.8434  ORF g.8434 m.8434 type:complete len:558 (-) comp3891_c0_seq1:101-1774(-)